MHRLYLILILLLPALGIGVYASAIWFVDPYGFYRPTDRGAFPIKPDMVNNQNMAKAQIVRQIKPDTVIIGSSRVDYAIDPTHDYFKDKNAYNFGLKGMRVIELEKTIAHAVHSGAKEILWGLDFFSFNANIHKRPSFSEARLYDGANEPDTDLTTLISISSLKPAFKTLIRQSNPESPYTYINGQHSPGELDKKTRNRGSQSLFDNSAFVFLSNLYFPAPHRSFELGHSWESFERTLQFLKDNNVKANFFIAPQHAYQYALIYQSGLFDTYKEWKAQVRKLTKKYNIDFHDYTALSPLTTERIPKNKGEDLQHYWESSHYKPIIGNMILNTLMDKPSKLRTAPQINQFERDLIRYQCKNPDIVTNIRNKIIKAGLENRLIQTMNCR